MWKGINIYWVTPRVFSWGTPKHQRCPVNNDTPVHGRNLSIPVDFVAGRSLCGSTRHSGAIFSSLPSQCSAKKRHSCSLKKTVLQWTPYINVKGNDRVDRLAGGRKKIPKTNKQKITSGLRLGKLKCWGAWNTTCGHKSKDITPSIAWKTGVERGSAWQSSLKGREKAILSQTNIGTVSKAAMGKPLRDGVERIWYHLELNWTNHKT